MKSKPKKHCSSLSCPERFSTCCYSICQVSEADNSFQCSMCKKEFVGFPCDAGETTTKTEMDTKDWIESIKKIKKLSQEGDNLIHLQPPMQMINGELKKIIAEIANEVRRLKAWRASDISGEDEAELWFDRIMNKLDNL